ncbi:HAD-IB family phosphatase [Desulfurococcus mucosus]|uniref:phosphoserine phosphatase n=1 Tax=Desulfurococcus mucosus (strain ATCC 35584 / DSM 2162 / JCM 9187 / O7/1) TaxID=765177 RepID=E8R9I7_DESM0|nr:HAD-IB family phosphatase [Desulfurococcus mucosus]ADV65163.1 phosphoserine phosphatase [Desulfurococcus mucosus DSM 2162]
MPSGLVVFDCDGVLTENHSSWQVLHEYFGSRDNKYFADLYRRGLISYLDWMKIDIALMIHSWGKPITRVNVEDALSRVKVKPEARRVVEALNEMGYIVAVVSSGIDVLVERVCREVGVDLCFYNKLRFEDGELVPGGEALVPLREKPRVIRSIAENLSIRISDTYYVGDSEWDIDVFRSVGHSIAVEPCGEACRHAEQVVSSLREIPDALRRIHGVGNQFSAGK